MKKVELLAPAGNFECLKAAINNGADAVYLGGKNFSARAFANNFNEEELVKAVKYAHLRNVKIYVTLNTLLNEKEFNNAIKMAKFYYDNDVDALLVQDLGLYYYLKNNYSDFELHCSTQMHVHNIEGIKTAKKLGFKRVVVARESTLEFIEEACKQNIEIETFVHGAICVSYSGQCLMSSVTKNRSANKGMCAQCCRLKYNLYNDNTLINTDTDYLLSPKDMCLVNDIPSLIKAGVSSFKIEGRLKSSAYVGYVTSIYRKAIDSYYENIEYKISEDELIKLKVLFNRNFTNEYLTDNNDLFGQKTPNHLGIEIGEAFKYDGEFTYIKLNSNLNQFDGIRINDFGCIVNMLYKNKLLINGAVAGDIVAIKTDNKEIGKVFKTLDYELENKINNISDKKIPINLTVDCYANSNIKVILETDDNKYEYVSNVIAQEAKNSPLTTESTIKQFSKLNETEYKLEKYTFNSDNSFVPVKDLNDIRRNAIASFNEYRLNHFLRKEVRCEVDYVNPINSNDEDIVLIDEDIKSGNTKYSLNYVINRESIYSESDNALISEIGGLLKGYKNKIAYYTLNCSNSYCYEFLKRIGFEKIIVSSELNLSDIEDLKKSYKERTNLEASPYILKDGNRVLMYLKANPFDKYMKNGGIYTLNDNNNEYYIKHNNNITEIIEKTNNIDVNQLNKQVFTVLK